MRENRARKRRRETGGVGFEQYQTETRTSNVGADTTRRGWTAGADVDDQRRAAAQGRCEYLLRVDGGGTDGRGGCGNCVAAKLEQLLASFVLCSSGFWLNRRPGDIAKWTRSYRGLQTTLVELVLRREKKTLMEL